MKEFLFKKVDISIRDLTIHGDGIGDYKGFTIFVPEALPGERVTVKIKKVKKNYGIGKLIKCLSLSKSRVTPKCPYFGRCGGCQIMHLLIEGQVNVKKSRIEQAFKRVGKLNIPVDLEVVSSPNSENYRNKIQLPFCLENGDLQVGLFEKGSHKIIPIKKCLIHNLLGENIVIKVVEILKKHKLLPFREEGALAILRHLLVRTAIKNKEVLVVLITHSKRINLLKECAKEIMMIHPSIKGVVHHENKRSDNVILDEKFSLLAGRDHVIESIHELKYKVSAPSFFQVNPFQAENLYKQALEFGGLRKSDVVVDAYSGIGSLALFLAKHVKEVIGIECVERAILDAKENADLNGIENTKMLFGDVKDLLSRIKKVDVIYINPPRRGCDVEVLEKVLELKPRTIIYISCDPTTLARDAAILCEKSYTLSNIKGFDMFPQTMHVETCAQFTMKHS